MSGRGWLAGLLLLTGCGTVTSVHGWAGGPVRSGLVGGEAVVEYEAPRPGWTLHVDRGEVNDNTAVLWVTAAGDSDGPLDRTATRVTWTDPNDGAFECVQVYLRIEGGTGRSATYLPAAVGCGEIAH